MIRKDNEKNNSKVFNINKVVDGNLYTITKISKIERDGKIHNIVEEDNTIYEVENQIDKYSN